MTDMPKSVLPQIPSELIDLAIADLEKVQADPRYKINMAFWHEHPNFDPYNRCYVCLAGSVMAKTLNIPADTGASPYGDRRISDEDSNALQALDDFRVGYIEGALESLNINIDEALGLDIAYEITPYEADPVQFILDMKALANHLRTFNL